MVQIAAIKKEPEAMLLGILYLWAGVEADMSRLHSGLLKPFGRRS